MKSTKKKLHGLGLSAVCAMLLSLMVSPASLAFADEGKTFGAKSQLAESTHLGMKGPGMSAAESLDVNPTSSTTVLVSKKCIAEVKATTAKRGISSAQYLPMCETRVRSSMSRAIKVDAVQAQQFAQAEGMKADQAKSFVAAAALGQIYYKDWSDEAVGVARGYVEKIKGRLYFDGERSWVAKYRGYTGSFSCHNTGSYAVGVVVSVVSCSKWRNSSNGVVHRDKFDVSAVIKGGPMSMTHEIVVTGAKNGKMTTTTN